MSIIDLIDAMDEHRKNGGSPFDCPSHRAPIELKRELQRGISEVFKMEMSKWSIPNEH